MSVTRIQVHLPSFSHSFTVSLPSDSTVIDLKNEISKLCVGSPSPTGQRVICKGRVLEDKEVVGEVWKASDGPHICHLAVHPSAWTAAPPSSVPPLNSTSSLQSFPTPPTPSPQIAVASTPNTTSGSTVTLTAPQTHPTYPYIQYMHTNALRILAGQPRLSWPNQLGDLNAARAAAKRGIETTGRSWPLYLNYDFPANTLEQNADQGVKYVSIFIDNLPYLSLSTPDATPTALQIQAFRVLTYTFPLLCIHPIAQVSNGRPLHVNAIMPRPLPQFALPLQGVLPQFPIRPLIIPLVLLTLRTALLLYFFQPARKPLLGLVVLIWVVWEVIGAFRGVLGGENGNGGRNNRVDVPENPRAGAGGVANMGAGVRAEPRAANLNNATHAGLPNSQDAILNHLAEFNLLSEARFVEPDSTPDPNAPSPSILHQIKTFFLLLLLTLHPALWDRRRAALRAREGRIREDARTREARTLQRERERAEREEARRRGIEEANDAEATTSIPEPPPPPKPFWVAEYVQRIRSGDWVDD